MTAGVVDAVDASGVGVVVVPGVAGKRLGLASLMISVSVACNVKVVDEEGHLVFPTLYFPANGGVSSGEFTANSYSSDHGGKGLKIMSSVANAVSAAIEAYLIPVQS
jgi:hypothetical protein